MPQDYMDMSRGVGQLGVTAQRIGQMVAQQRFRQAVAQQQLMQQQREFEEVQRMNQFRQALMQAQAGSEGAQRRKYDQEVEDAQYQGGQRQALQQAIQSALGQKRRADTEEDLFGMETDPLNLDTVAAIQATLPNAQTPVQLMRNIAQGQAMQNPNMLEMIALGTRNPVMNVPAGATPLDLTSMTPGTQTPFRPFAPGANDPRLKELGSVGNIFKSVADAEQGDPNFGIYQQATNRIGQLLSQIPQGTNAPPMGVTPAQKVRLANQLAQEHPDWSKEQVLQEVRRQLGE